MNYIELINQFWQTRRTVKFSSIEADLYFFLLQESNIRSWENPFECSNGLICVSIGITEKTLIDVRNRLQQKGLISFENGKRNQKSPVYTICYRNKVSNKVSNTVSNEVSNKVSNSPNIYTNKTETKQEEVNKEKPQLVFPFSSDLFFEKWEMLLKAPKWKIKITPSLQLALDKLKPFDEETAIKILDAAIKYKIEAFNDTLFQIVKNEPSEQPKPEKTDKNGKNKRFIPPTKEQVFEYFTKEKGLTFPEANKRTDRFINFYESKNWMVGRSKMSKWKAAATNSLDWEIKNNGNGREIKTSDKLNSESNARKSEILRRAADAAAACDNQN